MSETEQGSARLQHPGGAEISGRIQTPPATGSPCPAPDADPHATLRSEGSLSREELPGDAIGRYKLLERIGEGGFGAVYVAEQQEPIKRRVALKITKLGMDTRQVVARFEAERQALALMEHPNIANVFDAGATETGRPYFVMELVRGEQITDYCDQARLATRKRLELFVLVCRAIEHAHQKGIIHRDIKPSNILVTLQDGSAVPKVIDFGIAKATQAGLTGNTVHTQFDQFIGTPAYMSPEQAGLGGLDIDTRSDIYSLGVLLYELLTSQTPFASKNLPKGGFDDMRRTIREMEPLRPSLLLGKQDASVQASAAQRHGTDAPKLIDLVKGDLDWVVMKCLEKDRSRRYETAASLAEDVQRFLDNEAVTARPPSNLYRFRKLVRRNRLAFAAATAVLASLLVALGISTWFAVNERQQRDLALVASARADSARQIAEASRLQAESARRQAEAALAQSEVDRKLADAARQKTEAALQQSEVDRAKAEAAEKKAVASQLEAETARAQAVAALQQAEADRTKAEAADKKARDSQLLASSAQQQAGTALKEAESAETRATTEAGKSQQAAKAAAAEAGLRQQAEAAAAAAAAEASQAHGALSNVVSRLNLLPPSQALKVADAPVVPSDAIGPWTTQLTRARAGWHARQGDWTNAMIDYSALLDRETNNPEASHALAALLVQIGDLQGYGRLCARLLARLDPTNGPASLAGDCLLAAAPGLDLAAVSAWARQSASNTNALQTPEQLLTQGLAEFRQGRWTEAADWAGKALAADGQDFERVAGACAVLSMSEQKLGQAGKARSTLAAGEQVIDTKLPKLESGDLGADWPGWIAAHSLIEEARGVVEKPAATK